MPGTPPTTGRMSIPRIADGDAVQAATQLNGIADTVDAKAGMYTAGTRAARLAATNIDGLLWRETDTGLLWLGTGSTWLALGISNPIGSLSNYAGSSDPVDVDGVTRWLVCDGRALGRTTYSALYTAISTTYGAGDGSTTFNIPDLRGRVAVGADAAGAHLPTNHPALGVTGGEEQHTLSTTELPSHTHGLAGDSGDYLPYSNNAFARDVATGGTTLDVVVQIGTVQNVQTSGHTGGGGAHNNLPPYVAVNHIIKVL